MPKLALAPYLSHWRMFWLALVPMHTYLDCFCSMLTIFGPLLLDFCLTLVLDCLVVVLMRFACIWSSNSFVQAQKLITEIFRTLPRIKVHKRPPNDHPAVLKFQPCWLAPCGVCSCWRQLDEIVFCFKNNCIPSPGCGSITIAAARSFGFKQKYLPRQEILGYEITETKWRSRLRESVSVNNSAWFWNL